MISLPIVVRKVQGSPSTMLIIPDVGSTEMKLAGKSPFTILNRCNMRKGDQDFVKVLEKVKDIAFHELNCHVSSSISNCKAFIDIDSDLRLDFAQAVMQTDYDVSYANFADNDQCVAKSITNKFWQDRLPNSALLTTQIEFTLLIVFMIIAFI